jgi:hypothetical protein
MRDCYLATCVHCGAEVVVAERFADPEFAALRAHLVTTHPELATVAGTLRVLQHYSVSAHPGH